MARTEKKQVIIAGGGPVGALSAVFLSRRGFKVDLYEARSDIRKSENATGRSINLALSLRGLTALNKAGIEAHIKSFGTPMYSRYIHMKNGQHYTIPYGKKGQHLLSVDRLLLNRELLTVAERCPDVNIHFQHKLVFCDPSKPTAVFSRSDESRIEKSGNLLLGCDGAYSSVRKQMLKKRMDFSQEYIPHGYKELSIPPTSDGDYAMPPNHLHIWPRHEFMLIALPNLDKSFTLTLFMPFEKFELLQTENDVIAFFEEVFPDSVPHIGRDNLKKSFFYLPPLPLVSVKCSPYHFGETTVLLGDAAHAMVPFFGQGLNSGLEDAFLFDKTLGEVGCNFAKALPEFSHLRVKAGQAIADLSKLNYLEMRSHVATPWFLFRRKVDRLLNFLFPSIFVPRYSLVTFTRTSYEKVVEHSRNQDRVINSGLFAISSSLALFALWFGWKMRKRELTVEHLLSLFVLRCNNKSEPLY